MFIKKIAAKKRAGDKASYERMYPFSILFYDRKMLDNPMTILYENGWMSLINVARK